MKATSLLTILFLLHFFSIISFAQGEAAVPFLLLNPSPSLSAMGSTGTALPTEDPFGFIWNPAQLGYTSQTNNLSFIFYPSKVEWAGINDLLWKGIALNAGYNFKDLIGFLVSFGFGYSNPELNFGTFYRTDENGNIIGQFEAKEYYNAYSLGLGVDYFVQLSIGYTIKDVTSLLADFSPSPDSGQLKAEGSELRVYYSNIGDAPERILLRRLQMTGDWQTWKASPPEEVLQPETDYEGVTLPIKQSVAGAMRGREHALRDPGIFVDSDNRVYLLYSIAGESGIGIAELPGKPKGNS